MGIEVGGTGKNIKNMFLLLSNAWHLASCRNIGQSWQSVSVVAWICDSSVGLSFDLNLS